MNILPKESDTEDSKIEVSKFRIYAKRLFLTYSRTELKPQEVLLQLQEKFPSLLKYIISQEDHASEPERGRHIHAYLEFDKKINILSPTKLDLKEGEKIIHGEYTAVKSKENVINYVKKDGNFICNFETDSEFRINLQKIAFERGLEEALDYFVKSKPNLVSTSFLSVKRNLESFLKYKSAKLVPKFTEFNYPDPLLDWFDNYKDSKTLFLTGPSGSGKTEGIINLLVDYNPLRITSIDALKNLTSAHKAIIFDDMNWSEISREVKINLLEKVRSSDIRIIYNVITLPSDLIKVVISNNLETLKSYFYTDKAIDRRLYHVDLEKPLFEKNIVQNANVIINVFNNYNSEQNTN